MVLSKDKKEGIVVIYDFSSQVNKGYNYLRIPEVDTKKYIGIKSGVIQGEEYYGDEIINSGLIFKEPLSKENGRGIEEGKLDSLRGDFKSILIKLESDNF